MANEIRMSDDGSGVTLVWAGGHTIRVLGADGREIDVRSIYVSTKNDENEREIRESMRRILAELRRGE